jgi:MoaD family protein
LCQAQISNELLTVTRVNIKYFGMLHDIVGKRSEVLSVESSNTAMDLVEILSKRHGARFRDFVFESNDIRPGLAFAINGSSVDRAVLSKTKCKEISEFVILPPISGGAK